MQLNVGLEVPRPSVSSQLCPPQHDFSDLGTLIGENTLDKIGPRVKAFTCRQDYRWYY